MITADIKRKRLEQRLETARAQEKQHVSLPIEDLDWLLKCQTVREAVQEQELLQAQHRYAESIQASYEATKALYEKYEIDRRVVNSFLTDIQKFTRLYQVISCIIEDALNFYAKKDKVPAGTVLRGLKRAITAAFEDIVIDLDGAEAQPQPHSPQAEPEDQPLGD